MVRSELKVTELYCPHASCGKRMVRDECGIFCQGCGYEAATWADPVDADVPMDVLVARERRAARQRIVRIGAALAVAIALLVGGWFTIYRSNGPAPSRSREVASISFEEMRAAFAEKRLPEGVAVPSYYGHPELFLVKKLRESQTVYADWWRQRSAQEKYDLLLIAKQVESEELLPVLFEVSWFTTAQEPDERVTRALLDALYLSSDLYVEVAIFVCDHIATTTPFPTAQADARRYLADLVERRQRLGN
jgi:hypothetical protein